MEELDIVDDSDRVIGKCTRKESYKKGLTNRVVCVVLKNSEGKIMLQKRSKTCGFMPGAWDASAGGHVESGQTYFEAVHRELFEEVGITAKLKFIAKVSGDRCKLENKYTIKGFTPSKKTHCFFKEVYEGVYDGEFNFGDGEVEKVEYFSLQELKEMINEKHYMTPGLIEVLEEFYLN